MVRATVWQATALDFSWPEKPLFRRWSARIPSGVGLVCGDESSGKSTALRLMAGQLTPHGGQMLLAGAEFHSQPARYRAEVFWTDPRSTEHDAVSAAAYFESLRARYPRFSDHGLHELLGGLSLTAFLDKPLHMLSTGSKRKVWLAAGLACGAALTLVDEPFAALDRSSIGFLQDVLQDLDTHSGRAWVMADYAAPEGVPLATRIDLPL